MAEDLIHSISGQKEKKRSKEPRWSRGRQEDEEQLEE